MEYLRLFFRLVFKTIGAPFYIFGFVFYKIMYSITMFVFWLTNNSYERSLHRFVDRDFTNVFIRYFTTI